MKNKDRMQFNLKNWKKQYGHFDFWNRTDNKIATFEKVLNKDKYKKKQEDFKMSKKLMRIVFGFIFISIGTAQISQAKDFLDLSKLVLSFVFGMWVLELI